MISKGQRAIQFILVQFGNIISSFIDRLDSIQIGPDLTVWRLLIILIILDFVIPILITLPKRMDGGKKR